ncbi:MAG: Spy/CpxP family protein refolding chaperone [Planctomycetota bacterium]
MATYRTRSFHLTRTVPTAAAALMIASGIALAQSAGDPTTDANQTSAQASPESQAEGQGEMTREQRRERRREMMDQRGERGGPPHRMEGGERGPRAEGRGGPGGPEGEAGPRNRAGQGLRMLLREVNPTDEQQDQIRAIVRETTGPMQQYMAENADALRAAREEMEQARADRDREAGEAAREKMRALREAGPQVDREALTAQVRGVLNESQQQVFDANLAELQQRRQEHQAQREQRMQERGERSDRGDRPERKQCRGGPDGAGSGDGEASTGDQLDL